MSEVLFYKVVGAGNDFILIDNRKGVVKERAKAARLLCDRRYSVGADGLILMENSKEADIRMRIFNPDGSEAEMCGNGVRCMAVFAKLSNVGKKSKLKIETPAGIIETAVRGKMTKVRMPDPKNYRAELTIFVSGKSEKLSFIDTGVPHAVKILPIQGLLKSVDVYGLGRAIRKHAAFAPKGTNVNFIFINPDRSIQIRTYERGVEAETLSCGTGSVAAALCVAAQKNFPSPILIKTQGGEDLKIYFEKEDGEFRNVEMEGPVEVAFQGRVAL